MINGTTTRLMVSAGLYLVLMTCTGCAFGDRQVTTNYHPVMGIKAHSPLDVDVRPFKNALSGDDPRKIGQVRNGYGMVTAKAQTSDGDATQWIRRALADELTNAGFRVTGSAAAQPIVVTGAVNEFLTDMTMAGYDTRLRVRFVVTRSGTVRLDKEFSVQDGGSGITASNDEFQTVTVAALTKLMRRALPEIIAAIEG